MLHSKGQKHIDSLTKFSCDTLNTRLLDIITCKLKSFIRLHKDKELSTPPVWISSMFFHQDACLAIYVRV